jgi:putative transposase
MKKTKEWQNEEALKRFQIITQLLAEELDVAKKKEVRNALASKHKVSERSLYRYEKAYQENGFEGLKPKGKAERRDKRRPINFRALLDEAIQLKREVPTRSIAQIILILEMEGQIEPNTLKRSTLQRHLLEAGFGKKQMKKYTEARRSSSKRFCKPHRMMLVQADIKFGPKLPIGKNKTMVKTFLSVIIDDHSKLVLDAKFYDNQEAYIIEDSYKRAILKYGKMDAVYQDNGKQYKSKQLLNALSQLGIKTLFTKPYSPQSKGGVEVFNRAVNSFLKEAKAHKIKTLEELNNHWTNWLEEYYHNKAHEGIHEYYRSLGSPIPDQGISPRTEWLRDTRPLTFLDVQLVAQAFLHYEERIVDKGACISFQGRKYEVSASLIGAKVNISYDPMEAEVLTVTYKGIEPFEAKPVQISSYCDPTPEIPECMTCKEPEVSRLLEGLQQRRENNQVLRANAVSFGKFRKEES